MLARSQGARLVEQLDTLLWQPLGAGTAKVSLDRLGGDMAAHCCLAARARDWLRLARLLADDGRVDGRQLLPAGFVVQMSRVAPVHPGYGLGVAVQSTRGGETLLWARSPGRVILVVPDRRITAVWFSASALPDAAESELLAALGLGR